MIKFLTETIAPLVPIVFPLVFLSQLLLGLMRYLLKLFNRPKINLYPAGEIEIGIDRLGPTAILFGTMQAVNGDVFITKLEVVARHLATKFSRTLEGRAFKPYLFGLQTEEDMKYELVAAFALKVVEPFKYNIVFIDDLFVNQETERARAVIEAWKNFQTTVDHELPRAAQIEAFYQQPAIQAIAQTWQGAMYWVAGQYQLDFCIYSGKRKMQFSYQFNLTANDEERLRGNVKLLIYDLCGERVSFGRAFTPYLNAAT